MPRIVLVPLILLAIAIVGVLALGIPPETFGGAPTQAPYEKTLDIAK